jgi:hypothetical protein
MPGVQRNVRGLSGALMLAIAGLGGAAPPPADEFLDRHAALVARNPPGVTLNLETDRRRYFQGQRIALTLRYATARAGLYSVDSSVCGRTGRAAIDQFRVDREADAVDPLRDWFEAGRAAVGGGLDGFDDLDVAADLRADLNEWFRFDRPGRYRLYVVSGRLAYRTTWRPLAPVTSSVVEFEIVAADPVWAAETLERATATLDRIAAHVASRPMSYGGALAVEPDLARAARTLRFLGTPDAARAMVRYYAADTAVIASRDGTPMFDRSWELLAGLVGSPHRDLVIAEMGRRAGDAAAASRRFVETLDWLRQQRAVERNAATSAGRSPGS